MKTIISILLLLGGINFSLGASSFEEKTTSKDYFSESMFVKVEPCTVRISILITGFPSKKKDPCTGLGFRCLKLEINKPINRINPNQNTPGQTQMMFEQLSLDKVRITFPSNEVKENYFVVTENVELPESVVTAFGVRSITVLKGDYSVTNNGDGTLSAVLNTISK